VDRRDAQPELLRPPDRATLVAAGADEENGPHPVGDATSMTAPLVLLHGLGTGPEAWAPQVEAFSPDRTVLTPALELDRGFTVEREAARLWAELGGTGAVDLCGLSLGGLVALRMALDA